MRSRTSASGFRRAAGGTATNPSGTSSQNHPIEGRCCSARPSSLRPRATSTGSAVARSPPSRPVATSIERCSYETLRALQMLTFPCSTRGTWSVALAGARSNHVPIRRGGCSYGLSHFATGDTGSAVRMMCRGRVVGGRGVSAPHLEIIANRSSEREALDMAASGLLVVDDDYKFLVAVQRALGAHRPVFAARTSEEARTWLTSESMGIAVVDARLEDESGIDLLFELRDQHPAIRTALLSAFVTTSVMVAASSANVRVIAAKPCSIKQVVTAAETHAERIPFTMIPERLSLPEGDRFLALREMTRVYARHVLNRNDGNKTATAAAIDVSRTTLDKLLRGEGEGE